MFLFVYCGASSSVLIDAQCLGDTIRYQIYHVAEAMLDTVPSEGFCVLVQGPFSLRSGRICAG